jgi:hypothetical protein
VAGVVEVLQLLPQEVGLRVGMAVPAVEVAGVAEQERQVLRSEEPVVPVVGEK